MECVYIGRTRRVVKKSNRIIYKTDGFLFSLYIVNSVRGAHVSCNLVMEIFTSDRKKGLDFVFVYYNVNVYILFAE